MDTENLMHELPLVKGAKYFIIDNITTKNKLCNCTEEIYCIYYDSNTK